MGFAFSLAGNILKSPCQPNSATLAKLIEGLSINGEFFKASYFCKMVVAQRFHIGQIYKTLINGLCKIGQTRAATHTYPQRQHMIYILNLI